MQGRAVKGEGPHRQSEILWTQMGDVNPQTEISHTAVSEFLSIWQAKPGPVKF